VNDDLDAPAAVPLGKAFSDSFKRGWVAPEPVSRWGRFIYALFIDAVKTGQVNHRKRMKPVVACLR
jgi:hypothetical protein